MPVYKKIRQLLTPKELRRGYFLLCMILVMALLDTVGVASIIPFMAVLADPEVVETNRWLALAFNRLGFTDTHSFLLMLGLIVFILLVLSIAFKALTLWALIRFAHMRNHSLSCRLFKGYLDRPYTWFLNRHSSDLGKTLLSEISVVMGEVILPIMQIIAHATVSFFLIILLVLVDPFLALMVSLILGGAYTIIYMGVRNYLFSIGKDRVNANRERFHVVQESLSGIKEVKIFGREQFFLTCFVKPSFRFAKHKANSQTVSILPRYILEILAFGGILLISLYLFRSHGNFSRVLPILVVYAFAGYKLLPALQQIYLNITKLRFGLPALDSLHKDIMEFTNDSQSSKALIPESLTLNNCIILKDIYFTYPKAQVPSLKRLNLNIPVSSTIGLMGTTGAGKTTTVDIILGLLLPDRGHLFVDNKLVNSENVRSWQRMLGYVPQQIYLADDSVAANIAFGVPPEGIDLEALIRAAKVAELHEFVTKDLDKGYDTLVGERGVRLSGGQRQRIGIARALYHEPKVLIMDEATSSLDTITEQYIMQAINRLKGETTIILIAHRLSTLQDCDRIYFLDQGKVKAQGTYDELLENCEEFKNMVQYKDFNLEDDGLH